MRSATLRTWLALASPLALFAACAEDSSSATPAAVTVVQLSAGDANCPTGGASFTAGGTTAYACTGAQGIQGTQGTQGIQGLSGAPAHYQTRNDVYCDSVASAVGDSTGYLIATCRSVNDLPLSGSCEQHTFMDAVLAWNRPNGWHDSLTPPANPAEYWCGWYRNGGSLTVESIPTAIATICCVAVP
jgi:hypothetical protein